jgi:hypothetical protein
MQFIHFQIHTKKQKDINRTIVKMRQMNLQVEVPGIVEGCKVWVAVPSLVVAAAAAVVVVVAAVVEIVKELAWVKMILNSVELVVGRFH